MSNLDDGEARLRAFIAGLLSALGLNSVGWLMAFGWHKKPGLSVGWPAGMLSNIPLAIAIIICLLVFVFSKEEL